MTEPKRPRLWQATPTVTDTEDFLGDELLAVPTTAGGTPLASVPQGTRHAFVTNLDTVHSVIVRPQDGALGGVPDSTHGIPIVAGTSLDVTFDPALALFLGVGGTVNVYVTYFG